MPDQNAVSTDDGGILARFKHPVFGPFIYSWMAINWKPIYILIRGDGTPEFTLGIVWAGYLQPTWNHSLSIFFLPLIIGGAVVFGGPQLLIYYDLYKRWAIAKANKWEPVTLEEHKLKVRQLENELASRDSKIVQLNYQLQSSRHEAQNYKEAWEQSFGQKVVGAGQMAESILDVVTQRNNLRVGNDDLKKQIAINAEEIASLKAQVTSLTKPKA